MTIARNHDEETETMKPLKYSKTKHLVVKQTTKKLNCYGLATDCILHHSRPGSCETLTYVKTCLSIQKDTYWKRLWSRRSETLNSRLTVGQTPSDNMTNVGWFSSFYHEWSRTPVIFGYRIEAQREANTEHCDLFFWGNKHPNTAQRTLVWRKRDWGFGLHHIQSKIYAFWTKCNLDIISHHKFATWNYYALITLARNFRYSLLDYGQIRPRTLTRGIIHFSKPPKPRPNGYPQIVNWN